MGKLIWAAVIVCAVIVIMGFERSGSALAIMGILVAGSILVLTHLNTKRQKLQAEPAKISPYSSKKPIVGMSPEDDLKKRLASGEINDEQYIEIKKILK
jgi:uncharacterized membrane protein